MAEFDLGMDVYDLNKQGMAQQKPLNHLELARKQELLEKWFEGHVVNYAMLLCNEQKDYTIFKLTGSSTTEYIAAKETIGCLKDRGQILSIDPADEKENAYEIWLLIDGEAYVYYLFDYSRAVIECE